MQKTDLLRLDLHSARPSFPPRLLCHRALAQELWYRRPTEAPLHFVYEAADCRLFYQPAMASNQSVVRQAAYAARWEDRACVEGSTRQASPGFWTGYFPDAAAAKNGGNASSTQPGGSPPTNGAAVLMKGSVWLADNVALIVSL